MWSGFLDVSGSGPVGSCAPAVNSYPQFLGPFTQPLYEEVRHILEANISHDTTNDPAHQRHAPYMGRMPWLTRTFPNFWAFLEFHYENLLICLTF